MASLRDVQEWLGSEIAAAETGIMHGDVKERADGEAVVTALRRVRNQLDRVEHDAPTPECRLCRYISHTAALCLGASLPEGLPLALHFAKQIGGL